MVEQDFSYESVFRFLRTGFTEFTRDEIDRLENYVVAVGLRGYKKWQAVWARKTSSADEEELAVLNGLRVRFVEMTESLVFVLKQRKKEQCAIFVKQCIASLWKIRFRRS